jgi:hypothetical protein
MKPPTLEKLMTQHILIATLGSEPQVVTLVLDLLQAKGYAIAEVIVVHTGGDAVQPALKMLIKEFSTLETFRYRLAPVEGWIDWLGRLSEHPEAHPELVEG